MKKIVSLLLIITIISASCKEKIDKQPQVVETTQKQTMNDGDEYKKNGRYCIYRQPITQTSDDASTMVEIKMQPDFSLPPVENESFERTYCDNCANIIVVCSGDTIFNNNFTKKSFAEQIETSLSEKAILNRIVCRGFSNNSVKLEAEISVPHSDEETYITIVIDKNGNTHISRYETEEVPEEIVEI